MSSKINEDVCPHYLHFDYTDDYFLQDSNEDLHISLPYPIHKPLVYSKVDPVQSYKAQLEEISGNLHTLKREVKKIGQKTTFSENTYVDLPACLVEHCCDNENIENCTDLKNYYSETNPYYTSGLLEYFQLADCEYLIRPDTKHNLRITPLAEPETIHKLKLETNEHQPIRGITHTHLNDQKNSVIITVRYPACVKLIHIKNLHDSTPPSIEWTRNFKHKLYDAKLSAFETYKLGVLNDNLEVSFYDLNVGERISNLTWNTKRISRFKFTQPNLTALCEENTNSLLFYDDRGRCDASLKFDALETCDRICQFEVMTENSSVYTATRHHLLRSDMRNLGKFESCSHMMRIPPCFMEFSPEMASSDRRFLCLSNQSGEKIMFFGGTQEGIGSLPVRVPDIFETLQECKKSRDLFLRSDLERRLNLSTVGVKFVQNSHKTGDFAIFSANSLGEICRHNITSGTLNTKSNKTSIKKLCKWIDSLPEPRRKLHLTSVANASKARFALNKVSSLTLKLGVSKQQMNTKNAFRFENSFKGAYDVENLGEIAANFAKIWSEENDGSHDGDYIGKSDVKFQLETDEKVSSWIQESTFL